MPRTLLCSSSTAACVRLYLCCACLTRTSACMRTTARSSLVLVLQLRRGGGQVTGVRRVPLGRRSPRARQTDAKSGPQTGMGSCHRPSINSCMRPPDPDCPSCPPDHMASPGALDDQCCLLITSAMLRKVLPPPALQQNVRVCVCMCVRACRGGGADSTATATHSVPWAQVASARQHSSSLPCRAPAAAAAPHRTCMAMTAASWWLYSRRACLPLQAVCSTTVAARSCRCCSTMRWTARRNSQDLTAGSMTRTASTQRCRLARP